MTEGKGKDLLGPLREADQELSRATLAPRTRQRIGDRLADAADPAAARRRGKRVGFALAVATAIALFAWPKDDRDPRDRGGAPVSGRAAGFAWQGNDCRATDRAGALHLDGTCRAALDELGVAITSRGAIEIVRVEAGVRLVRGTATFQVEHVAPDHPPVRVAVSAGVIEVTGTRFTVVQAPDRGHVDLHEGGIQFRAADDSVTRVQPGHRHDWADPKHARRDRAAAAAPAAPAAPPSIDRPGAPDRSAAPAAAEPAVAAAPSPREPVLRDPPALSSAARQVRHDDPIDDAPVARAPGIRRPSAAAPSAAAPPAAAPPAAAPPAATQLPPPPLVAAPTHLPDQAAAGLIDRVLALRAERRYREAAELLRQAGGQNWRPSTAELLSFEEGDIRARLPDRTAACDHWRRHRARFPAGLHGAAIEKSMKRLGCR